MTTMQTKCLPSGSPKGAEAVAFFQTVVALFKNLPTYQWLADAGITPGSSTYTLASMVNALQSNFGATPALDCESGGVYQVSYYYNLKGSVIDGSWIPVNAVRDIFPLNLVCITHPRLQPAKGSCSSSGIQYSPKSGSPVSTTTTKSSTTTTKSSTSTGSTSPTSTSVRKRETHCWKAGLSSCHSFRLRHICKRSLHLETPLVVSSRRVHGLPRPWPQSHSRETLPDSP